MERTFISILIVIFSVLLAFMALNTIMGDYVFPIFNQTAGNLSFMNQTTYHEHHNAFISYFYFALYIVVALPFLYLFVRLLKREPDTGPVCYRGSDDVWL